MSVSTHQTVFAAIEPLAPVGNVAHEDEVAVAADRVQELGLEQELEAFLPFAEEAADAADGACPAVFWFAAAVAAEIGRRARTFTCACCGKAEVPDGDRGEDLKEEGLCRACHHGREAAARIARYPDCFLAGDGAVVLGDPRWTEKGHGGAYVRLVTPAGAFWVNSLWSGCTVPVKLRGGVPAAKAVTLEWRRPRSFVVVTQAPGRVADVSEDGGATWRRATKAAPIAELAAAIKSRGYYFSPVFQAGDGALWFTAGRA